MKNLNKRTVIAIAKHCANVSESKDLTSECKAAFEDMADECWIKN